MNEIEWVFIEEIVQFFIFYSFQLYLFTFRTICLPVLVNIMARIQERFLGGIRKHFVFKTLFLSNFEKNFGVFLLPVCVKYKHSTNVLFLMMEMKFVITQCKNFYINKKTLEIFGFLQRCFLVGVNCKQSYKFKVSVMKMKLLLIILLQVYNYQNLTVYLWYFLIFITLVILYRLE